MPQNNVGDSDEEPYEPATVPPDPKRRIITTTMRTTVRPRPPPTLPTIDPNEGWFTTQRPGNVLQPGSQWRKKLRCVNDVCKTQTCINDVCRIDEGNTMNEFDNDGWNFDSGRTSSPRGFQPSINSGSSKQTSCTGNICQTRICTNGVCRIENGGSISSSDRWLSY